MMDRFFILYGYDDTDEAPILEAVGEHPSLKAAWRDCCFDRGVMYSYRDNDGEVTDEMYEEARL